MRITYFDPAQPDGTLVAVTGQTALPFYSDAANFTSTICSAMTTNNTSTPTAQSMAYVRDTRNNQTYKVKKMVDNRCWMIDNLKFIDTSIGNASDSTTGMVYNNSGRVNTMDGTGTQSAYNIDKAFYNSYYNSSHCYSPTRMPINSLTYCGYLYNWYSATNGTGNYGTNSNNTNVTGHICPANFKLPSGGTNAANSEFAILNASMNSGSLRPGSTEYYYTNWRPSGAWAGVESNLWINGTLDGPNVWGTFWTSTSESTGWTYYASFYSNVEVVYPGNVYYRKYYGMGVRCILI
jgi:uncharacterized protein (TIGR02145 family)